MSTPPHTGDRSARAQDFWAQNLDSQNLDRSGSPEEDLPPQLEAQFAWAPDSEAAWAWLNAGSSPSSSSAPIIDLGAGLGAMSFAFASRGAQVIAVDTSIERLAKLKSRSVEMNCAPSVTPIVASAEALPFREGSIGGLYSKSVIIHTDIPRASAEIGRVLIPGGRAALTEPQPANPFAWAYRNTLAPREWKSITTYFTHREQSIVIDEIGGGSGPNAGTGSVRPFYLFGFLAFAFQFALHNATLFRAALALTQLVDRILLALPSPLRRLAWFGLIEVEKPPSSSED